MRSVAYWVIVLAMVIGSGVGTTIWFGSETVVAKDAMVLGAAFPLIFKHAVDAAVTKSKTLGSPPVNKDEWSLLSYFAMR